MVSYDLNNSEKNALLLKIFITVIAKILKAKTVISIFAGRRRVLPTQQEPLSLLGLYKSFSSAGEVVMACPQKREIALLPAFMAGVCFIPGG